MNDEQLPGTSEVPGSWGLTMNNCVYHIQLRGQIDEEEVNEMSPLLLVREGGDTAVTQFSVDTDQSGLIGLMRHLHGLGYVFLTVSCEN